MPPAIRRFWIVSAFMLAIIGAILTWHVLSRNTLIVPTMAAHQGESSAPSSEETVLRAKMCNAIKEAVREYAAHVPALNVSISDWDSAIFAVYMLCMMQAPR